MYDFLSAMPPDLLLRLVRQRQAELRDQVERARRAAASRPPFRPIGWYGWAPGLGRRLSSVGRGGWLWVATRLAVR